MKKYIAEGVATFIFMFIAIGCACIYGNSSSFLIIPIAFGLAFIPSAVIFSDMCVCHLNPVVSFAMFLEKRIDKKSFWYFVLAQSIGTLAAMLVLAIIALLCNGGTSIITSTYASNSYGSNALSLGMGASFIAECVLTSFCVLAFLCIKDNDKFKKSWFIVIALLLIMICLLGLPLSGTSINPIRSLSSALVFGLFSFNFSALSQVFVFIIGPILGSLAGVWLYRVFCISKSSNNQK